MLLRGLERTGDADPHSGMVAAAVHPEPSYLSDALCRSGESDAMSKKILIIAGPNGAGKTTFARSFLTEDAQIPRFINADLIAAGLSPFAPAEGGQADAG